MPKLELAPLARAPPLAPPVFGRVVSGVDLRELGASDVAAIDAALLEHGFLLFEGQHGLSPADEWALLSSLSWLDPEFSAAVKGDAVENVAWWQFAELPMVRRLGDAVDSTTGVPIALLNRIGYEWHTDGGGASFLYSESAPEAPRRTTLFASGAAAYDALPVELQREAESVVLHYSNKFVTGDTATVDYLSGARMAPNGLRLARPAAPCVVSGRDRPPLKVEPADARAGDYVPGKGDHSRPLVRVHPVSGRKVLWATPKNMETISVGGVELGVEESRAKLEQLMSYGLDGTTDTALVYEHQWKAGDFVVMDNRTTMHSTTPYPNDDNDTGRQLVHHASMKARRPQPGWTDRGPLRPNGGSDNGGVVAQAAAAAAGRRVSRL